MSMVTFNGAIFLGSMRGSGKMANATYNQKMFKFDKFITIVEINFFYFSRELIFNHSGKLNKNRGHI